MKKYMIIIGILLVVTILALGCSSNDEESEAGVNTINAEEAMELMASGDGFILVDVRTQAEYDEGHIEGAVLLPLDQLETLSEEQLTDKEATLFVYCRSGSRSAQASQLLVDLGYQNVYDFGGIVDWPGEIVK